jgi:hypothetical protein
VLQKIQSFYFRSAKIKGPKAATRIPAGIVWTALSKRKGAKHYLMGFRWFQMVSIKNKLKPIK